ncbi:MAG: type II toxin-antitoxin system Phd/YefM family antitoxin [Spirochaetaceae bacterium]
MAEIIGAFDAKTHLSEYLERAHRGESFVITRRGKPLAHLGPASDPRESLQSLLIDCAALRGRVAAESGVRRFSVAAMVREDRDRDGARDDPGDEGDSEGE